MTGAPADGQEPVADWRLPATRPLRRPDRFLDPDAGLRETMMLRAETRGCSALSTPAWIRRPAWTHPAATGRSSPAGPPGLNVAEDHALARLCCGDLLGTLR